MRKGLRSLFKSGSVNAGRKRFRLNARLMTIPQWMSLHYALAGFVFINAEPVPTATALDELTDGVLNPLVLGIIFIVIAIMLYVDKHITPRKFYLYMGAWIIYVVSANAVAVRHFFTHDLDSSAYMVAMAYTFEIVVILIAFSVYRSVHEVSEAIADKEAFWLKRRELSKTDLKEYKDQAK